MVCTRNRGQSIVVTIRSILACNYPHFTLVIVDQSSDHCTADAIAPFRSDPRLRYISTGTTGLSRGLNIGLAFSNTNVVIITDDDCEVPTNWIEQMVTPFLRYPQVGLVFCDVIAASHDRNSGFVPVSISPRSFLIESLNYWQPIDGVNIGIGAGMAILRSAAEAIGGFDPGFGSGSRFKSGNDLDFTLRMLMAGYHVYRTNTVSVIHYGFRTYAQLRQLIRNNMFSIGAISAQIIRRGYWHGVRYFLSVFLQMVLLPVMRDLTRLKVPPVLGRVIWLFRGLVEGLRTPLHKPNQGLVGMQYTRMQ
ncbi:MAG: glycosyltransferase family 2 protein [Oscillochloris sp.]|nr:glycosyltransferase family 2 protein [Oscillochloris sp.]